MTQTKVSSIGNVSDTAMSPAIQDIDPETARPKFDPSSHEEADNERRQEPSDGQPPGTLPSAQDLSSWRASSYKYLKVLLAEAKGAATKPVVKFIKKHLAGTKLIFVVGQTGTGKSTLLSEICGQDVNIMIGHEHKSGTKCYQVCPATIDGEQYIFVDTAGFGASDLKDTDTYQNIIACLDALGPFVQVAGLLFVCTRLQQRLSDADLKTIEWVKCFCGPEFYRLVTIVFTQWDAFSPKAFAARWKGIPVFLQEDRVQELILPPAVGELRYHGAHIYHHGIRPAATPDDLPECLDVETDVNERAELVQTMIKERYGAPPVSTPQVQREISKGIPWNQTQAAKVLHHSSFDFRIIIKDGLSYVSTPSREKLLVEPSSTPEGKASLKKTEPTSKTLDASEKSEDETKSKESQSREEAAKEKTEPREEARKEKTATSDNANTQAGKSKSILGWLEVAKDLAYFFWQSKKNSANDSKSRKPGEKSRTWAESWNAAWDWWSGAPKE